MNWKRFTAFTFALLAVLLLSYQPAHAQSNVQAGSIQGVVTIRRAVPFPMPR